MDKVTVRALIVAVIIGYLAFAPRTAQAQAALEPTQIEIGSPAQLDLGGPVTVQAVLADSQGHAISGAVIYFTAQASFLGESGEVVLAQAVTNSHGQAVAQVVENSSGSLDLSAEFRGDATYAPSKATIQPTAAGGGQVYSDHVGVDIPGLNVPPVGVNGPLAAVSSQPSVIRFIQSLWPAMNGWPLAALLLLVWSTYLFSASFVVRLSRLGDEPGDSLSDEPGRSA